ncbi:MAG: hypothetical protein QE494_13380 [Ramlibacter sp.]|uniref:hypothetical protein n=1 Tax=Ramlibacter sp. TaxID=1917967 RepID=UPI002628205E|nr:hypothetical protein [Ramlibacter sp.]MDH4377281.1 hypothetical protein [Ramlibacter sp.]
MGKILMVVAWPAFLAACILEALVFALIDPLELTWGQAHLGWSRQTVYTLAFFVFWGVVAMAASVAVMLARAEPGTPEPQ